MRVHEYQSKGLFKKYGIPVPVGMMADDADSAYRCAKEIGKKVVVKAQIHAGGREKGGGVRPADSPEAARNRAREIIGMNLVTHQTGPKGRLVRKVLVEEALDVEKEFYLGMVVDRNRSRIVVIASEEGGVEIEAVGTQSPEKIIRELIDPKVGMQISQARKMMFQLHLPDTLVREGTKLIMNLYRLFIELDASLAEINPLVVTTDGRLLAVDAKIDFDDNALFRHPDIEKLRDVHEEEPAEAEASQQRLSYVKLDGQVGCMVNGAGLAMATMDIIKLYGLMPANFLDVGGAVSSAQVEHAFRILLSDSDVKAVFINIFGGIVRCDRVANGVVQAAKRLEIKVPIVVRLAGTNSDLAGEILNQSGLKFTVASDLDDAAKKVVAAVNQ